MDERASRGQDADLRMQLTLLAGGMVSVDLEEDGMGHGAAHPYVHSESIHWLLDPGRELRTGDVLAPETRWSEFLARRCCIYLNRYLEGDVPFVKGPKDSELVKIASSPTNWSFDRRGLTIAFPDASVSSHARPAGGTTVGWAALKPYLVSGFSPPK